jgi:ectoine hydroxylase-related dioxygenase (phytanoyl-CoA dioxygenase family)
VGPLGRNDFEGLKTQRAYALLKKTRALDPLVAHPRILAVVEAALGPDPLLSACLAVRILPGEKQQIPHFDCGFYPVPRPRASMGVSVIWALDPFTEENGATLVWPASHLWPDGRRPCHEDAPIPVVMPAGAAVIFDGDLWHAGGANRAREPRLGLTPQYCANWLRGIENMSLAVPPAVVATLSEPLQRLLGYAIRPPFMGYVDGVHPRRLLEGGNGE